VLAFHSHTILEDLSSVTGMINLVSISDMYYLGSAGPVLPL